MDKILIWDFNGTIIDDVQLCMDIETDMLQQRKMAFVPDLEWYRDHFCFPVETYYRMMGYTFESESFGEVSEEFNRAYDARFSECRLAAGFEEKLQEALQKGYRNIILSASRQDNLEKQCRMLGIREYFAAVIGTDDLYAASKVERAIRWMKETDIEPEQCMYIGDTLHDLETIEALGIRKYMLVSGGHQSRRILEQRTDKVADFLWEILI